MWRKLWSGGRWTGSLVGRPDLSFHLLARLCCRKGQQLQRAQRRRTLVPISVFIYGLAGSFLFWFFAEYLHLIMMSPNWYGNKDRVLPTSNCHLSTGSPVSLLVMTMISFEILDLSIHLFSCDMIFLMYALTWSSWETVVNNQSLKSSNFVAKSSYPACWGHTSWLCIVCERLKQDDVYRGHDCLRCKVFRWVNTTLKSTAVSKALWQQSTTSTYRIVLMQYSNCNLVSLPVLWLIYRESYKFGDSFGRACTGSVSERLCSLTIRTFQGKLMSALLFGLLLCWWHDKWLFLVLLRCIDVVVDSTREKSCLLMQWLTEQQIESCTKSENDKSSSRRTIDERLW